MFFNYHYSYLFAKAATTTEVESAFNLNHFAEHILLESALFLKIVIEGIALFVLVIAILRAIQKIVLGGTKISGKRMNRKDLLLLVRIDLGTALSLALEFLLAADIAATAVTPSWDKLAQLATISAIRTFLNYFLQKEIHELEHIKQTQLSTMDTQVLSK